MSSLAGACEPAVFVVLAAFNGERYIQSQIESIQSQTYGRWHLLISDDGSTDATTEIIRAAAERDHRIELLPGNGEQPAGVVGNFNYLLEEAQARGAQLCLLADQDDIWFPEKIARQVECFPRLGLEPSSILAHSDLVLIDREGEEIHPSFVRHRGMFLEPRSPLGQLLSLNYVTGCSVCLNQRLLRMALPIPSGVIMHDWWLALIAAATGDILYEGSALLAYRQHEDNVVGAGGGAEIVRRYQLWRGNWQRGNTELHRTFCQARLLQERLAELELLGEESESVLEAYRLLPTLDALTRVRSARRLGLRQGNWLLKMVLYARLLTAPGLGKALSASEEFHQGGEHSQ